MTDKLISDLVAISDANAKLFTNDFEVLRNGQTTSEKVTLAQLALGLTGQTVANGATVTTSSPLIDHTQTVNAAIAAVLWKGNMIPGGTPPTTAALLAQLQYNSTDVFKVARTGNTMVGGILQLGGTTNAFAGVTSSGAILRVVTADNSALTSIQFTAADLYNGANMSMSFGNSAAGLYLASDWLVGWSNVTAAGGNIFSGSKDTILGRAAAGVLDLLGNATGAAMQFTEMTAPAAGATNKARLYAQDNGSGKTQIMALFATGSAVQIAIEP